MHKETPKFKETFNLKPGEIKIKGRTNLRKKGMTNIKLETVVFLYGTPT